jgi:hypothetical protein
MNRKLIRGKLFVKNPKALNDPNIGHTLFRDMSRHYLRNLIVWDRNWGENGIEFNRNSPVLKRREDALTFISNLQEVMKLPAATELKLTGEFIVTIETNAEPHNFRVYVENGKVSYQEASYVWSEKTSYSD